MLIGLVLTGCFAYVTVYWENVPPKQYITATQIAVLPYVALIAFVLLLNPIVSRLRIIRPFNAAELMMIFIMGLVTSGISTFGLGSQLTPMVSGLFNRHFNNAQSRWDLYIEPYVNEDFFISEPGIREAAVKMRDAEAEWRRARRILSSAKALQAGLGAVRDAKARLAEAQALSDSVQRRMKEQTAKRELAVAEDTLGQAQERWNGCQSDLGHKKVIEDYPEMVSRLGEQRKLRQVELDALEAKAFKKIDLLRRPMPEHMRAIPGFIYTPGEGAESYFERIHRLRRGMTALKSLERAMATLRGDVDPGRDIVDEAARLLDEAIDQLVPIADTENQSERREQLDRELTKLKEDKAAVTQQQKQLIRSRRIAPSSEFPRLDKGIRGLGKEINRFNNEIAVLTREFEAITPRLKITRRVDAALSAIRTLRAELDAAPPGQYVELATKVEQATESFSSFDASWRRFLIGEVPWSIWLRPLFNWIVLILLTYVVLITFNVLIFRQWAYNENLIYPLAELPEMLGGVQGDSRRGIPAVFTSGLFWAGAAVSVVVMGWNELAERKIISGINEIPLTAVWQDYIRGSFLEGLGPKVKFQIFFTLIGLSFLVPAKISHSLWFFHLFWMTQMLFLVWLGYGVNERSFPMSWNLVLNFHTAQGGGALMVFAFAILWKCRKYLFCGLTPKAVQNLPADERKELRISSWTFLIGSAGLIAMLTWGLGVNLFYTLLCFLMILIITIGLVRAVAEGGVLAFQCWFTPFHFVRSMVGMNHSWTAPSFFAPLMVFYSVLFLDIKTFIAPAIANALKIRDDVRMSRFKFHLGLCAGILVALVVSLLVHIILAHHRGADNMNHWFYTGLPRGVYSEIKTMAGTNPVDSAGGKWWLMVGGLLMAGLLYFRQHIFWLPHPIGLVMLVNPLMHSYWFSIFLGWLFKTLFTKYGNKDTYARGRYFFVGLIAGELIMCLFGVDLNRG